MAQPQPNIQFGGASTSITGARRVRKRAQVSNTSSTTSIRSSADLHDDVGTDETVHATSTSVAATSPGSRKTRKLAHLTKSSTSGASSRVVESTLGGAGTPRSKSLAKNQEAKTEAKVKKSTKVTLPKTKKSSLSSSNSFPSSSVTTAKGGQSTSSVLPTRKLTTSSSSSLSTTSTKSNTTTTSFGFPSTNHSQAGPSKKKDARKKSSSSNSSHLAQSCGKSAAIASSVGVAAAGSSSRKSVSGLSLKSDGGASSTFTHHPEVGGGSKRKDKTSTASSSLDLRSLESLGIVSARQSKTYTARSSVDSLENSKSERYGSRHKLKEEIVPVKKSKYLTKSASKAAVTTRAASTSSQSAAIAPPAQKRKYTFRSTTHHGNKIDRLSEIPLKKARVTVSSSSLASSSSSCDQQQLQRHHQASTAAASSGSLRRSARCKTTTGSCASTSRRSSRGGGAGAQHSSAGATTGSSGKTVFTEALSAAAEGMGDSSATGSDDKHLGQASGSAGTTASGGSTSVTVVPTSSTSGSGTGAPSAGMDSESDDSEVGRLQALLEARGLPPHLFGALGPRVQHLLHRSMGASSTATKAQQLLLSLQATGDEDQQLQAVVEMCQMLVMGNEDTLTGFPVKQVVPALITLLSMDHNFDMMNNACRALTYMMEALPRSSGIVLDAVPTFLEKLQVIQCMDVAEQSLTALEMLSRRHSKAILQAQGVKACLHYIDFFSIVAQRAALSVTANCCNNLHPDEFAFVSASLPNLAKRLTQQDKKSVESICLVFSRLVDSFQNDSEKLREMASDELLTNIQQLLVVSPPLISTGTFITVLRMLSTMCGQCSDLALVLLKLNIADTLCYLLTASSNNKDEIVLISRSPQELYEITCLIGELMPRLPTDGLFAVDSLLMLERVGHVSGACMESIQWQWKDDRNVWHPYNDIDSRLIESAHQAGEDEISLSTLGREYTLDFHTMQQINENTGTTRSVTRRVQNMSGSGSQDSLEITNNNRCVLSSSNGAVLAASFIRSLFSVLYEVYSSSAGPAVRCKCLRALLRMVYYASPELLKEVLKNQIVSSHIAGMMASQDLRIVVGALQMAEILMQKLPRVFEVHFTREGVMHQIKQLADPSVALGASPPKQAPPPSSSSVDPLHQAGPSSNSFHSALSSSFNASEALAHGAVSVNLRSPTDMRMTTFTPSSAGCASAGVSLLVEDAERSVASSTTTSTGSKMSPQIRLSDVLKRKRTPKGRTSSSRKSKHDPTTTTSSSSTSCLNPYMSVAEATSAASSSSTTTMSMHDFFSKAAAASTSATHGSGGHMGTRSTSKSKFAGATSHFLASLNPARWGKSSERAYKEPNPLTKCVSSSNLSAGNKEKARAWVRERASNFLENYDTSKHASSGDHAHPAMNILTRLTSSINKLDNQCEDSLSALKDLRDIVLTSDISPFEVNHSGLVRSLLLYLTRVDIAEGADDRYTRIRNFLHVFAKCPLDANVIVDEKECDGESLAALVAKLNGCVSQLEQLPVKVHDLPAGTGSTTALKFFNTHQLKCLLQRHPSCSTLKQWKGGTVKIDPLALVQAIERYLVVRGYGRIRDKDTADSDDDNSEEEIDDTLAAVVIAQGTRHKLQFLIGDHVLPYNMTVYQAIRQFSPAVHADTGCETDTDSEAPLGSASVWVQSHTIYYRPVVDEPSSSSADSSHGKNALSGGSSAGGTTASSRKGKSSSGKSLSKRKADEIWSEGLVPLSKSPLDPYLMDTLPPSVTITDACLPVLTLLRVLNALNRFWCSLYIPVHSTSLLSQSNFVNCKICAKASRQLQDPLVIMTGNLPTWLQQIATTCPFLLNFEIRQLLLYASSFDRDRALQRLVDSTPEINNHSDTQERVTPRLDRRKRTVSRQDILKQAESLFADLAHSKALLEIQYENEVGTGLGPTLEFYALVSKELQKCDLELWHNAGSSPDNVHIFAKHGLYPAPVVKSSKVSHLIKLKTKFKFLGKFMAKAVMDSRMLDIPLCTTFYKWLLNQESCFNLSDLMYIVPEVYQTIARFQPILVTKYNIENNPSLSAEEKEDAINSLNLDGCLIEDLGLDFTLPGYPHIDLRKDGRDISVTIHNLSQYCKLVVHWYLYEGIARLMESFRDGFECVFPLAQLSMFYPEELEYVFCGSGGSSWDMKTLVECCRIDHGYTHTSKAIKYLFHILSCYDSQEQRDFLQFVTGSPRLPVGGFRALSPPLTIVRKTFESDLGADGFLPSVMTCVNYLKLPDYSSIEVMREKLRIAAQEGQHSFHLS